MAEQSYSYPIAYVSGSNTLSGANTSRTGIIALPFRLTEVWAVITTAVTVAATVITVKREPTPLDTTGTVSIGTFSVPVSVAGSVVKAKFQGFGDTDLAPGESIAFVGAGSSTAGVAYFVAIGHHYLESPVPETSFTTVSKPRSGIGSIYYAAATEV